MGPGLVEVRKRGISRGSVEGFCQIEFATEGGLELM